MEHKKDPKTFGSMHLFRSVAVTLAFCLMVGVVMFMIPSSTASAVPNPGETGYVSMHKYAATTDIDEVYKITLTMDVTVKELHPPSLITFVLDGTASMGGKTGTNDSTTRYEAVRQAMVQALQTLYDPIKNPNREHTYINVVMFGSYNSKAISLTEWATRKNTGATQDGGPYSTSLYKLPGIKVSANNPPIMPEYDNTLRASYHGSSNVYSGNVYSGAAFIPLVDPDTKGLNPYLAGLFNTTVNVDPSQTGISTKIRNTYYYGSAAYPMSCWGTFIGPGLKMAYDDLSHAIMNVNTLGNYTYSVEEQALMNKSVLVMADGNENALSNDDTLGVTQSWAAVLKASSSDIPTYYDKNSWIVDAGALVPDCNGSISLPPPTVTGRSSDFTGTVANTHGVGADVWSLIVGEDGLDSTNNYESTWTTNYSLFDPTTQNIARTMSSLVIPLDSNIITDFSSNAITGTTSWYNMYFSQYKSLLQRLQSSSNSFANRFQRATTVSAATSFFDNFATASSVTAGGIGNCTVVDVIGSQFDLYQYPGKPLLETSASNPAGIATNGGNTATASGRTITWNIGDITESCTVTLVYYIKALSGYQEGVYYQTNEYATASYTLNTVDSSGQATTEDITLNFPIPYARISDGTVENQEESVSESTPMDEGTSYGLPLFGMSYGENTQPYTASVTPAPDVKVEVLEEDAALTDVPNTNNATTAIVLALLFSVSSAVYIIIKKQSHNK